MSESGRVAHLRRRIPEVLRLLRSSARLMLEMEELWPAMRRVSATETLVLEELARIRSGMRRRLRVTDLRAARGRKGRCRRFKVPSRFSLWWEQVALFRANQLCDSRRDLARFWIRTRWLPGHGRMEALLRRVDQIALNGYRELRLASAFLMALSGRAAAHSPCRTVHALRGTMLTSTGRG